MKFFAALKSADFAAKLSASAGFDFAAAQAAGDVNALKAHIEQAVAAAVATASQPAADAASKVDTLNAALEAATKENATTTAAHSALTESMTAVGIQLPQLADTVTRAELVTSYTAAINDHIKIRACGELAKTGHPPVAAAPAPEATRPAGRALLESTIAASLAKLKAKS
jgi:hypothetical protein